MIPDVKPDRSLSVQGGAPADGVAEPCTLVLFGASGDLTQRMVMPAIFRLARRGLLSPEFRLIGYARSKMTDDEFRERMRKAVMREAGAGDEQAWPEFAAHLSYVSAEYDGDACKAMSRTTPFDMVVLKDLDRFGLVADVIDRVPKLAASAAYLKQFVREKRIEHKEYIERHGEDMPEVRDWKWQHS